jgi:hypothetical protein
MADIIRYASYLYLIRIKEEVGVKGAQLVPTGMLAVC